MKKTLLILMLALISWSVNSQTVAIPDVHFASWLQTNYPGCMSGNYLDTTCSSIQSTTHIDLRRDSIADLTGIQYFSNLTYLDCGYNLISFIPSLPSSLNYFSCDSNQLSTLPSLPNSLTYISCEFNNLSNLPSLPSALDTLMCGRNSITSIPALPGGLKILSCYQNQLTSIASLDSSLVELTCYNNLLSNLPAIDTALKILRCGINQLTSLPALPNGLTDLICYSNQLHTLPALDSSLVMLDCSSNMLDSLPALPNLLATLICSGNSNLAYLPALNNSLVSLTCVSDSLIVLPTLPASLNLLNCSANYLSVLPALPSALTYLACDNNLLPVLPGLPNSLNTLSCKYNQLATLPALGASLTTIYCDNNVLSVFPNFNSSLSYLSCNYNQLTTFPAFSNSLNYLSCSNNLIASFPPMNNSLVELWCSNNQLVSFSAMSNSLTKLYCNNNPLITLPTLPLSLSELNCEADQLTGLPTLPNMLSYLWCDNNSISCFPIFPFSISDSSHFNISANPFTCLPNYIPAMTWATLANPLCGAGNVSGCASSLGIVGFTYRDSILNCTKDSSEYVYINVPLKCYDNNNNLLSQTYTAINGIYDFPDTSGTYLVKIDTANVPYTYQCANPGFDSTVVLTTANSLVQNVNFNIICKPGFDVGTQSVVTEGLVFPGQTHAIRIVAGDMSHWYHMHCAAGISGQVQVTVTGPVTFSGIIPGALTPAVNNNVYTYTFTDFDNCSNTSDFGLKFTTSSFAQNGDEICVNVKVTPVGGDNDSTNNNYNYCYHVVNSFDPNMKETTPEKVLFGFQDYFTYTVHFQNTGTAPALNIRLLDTLDNNLDLSTFQLINYSHPNVVSLTGRLLTFNFHNINLPDSTSDFSGSQGFVQYRIKPIANLPYGTQIHNKADIYFDFNAPVSTNTSLNLFMRVFPPNSVNEISNDNIFEMYPNPATDNIIVNYISNSKAYTIHIFDAIGSLIKTLNCKSTSTSIPISEFPKGIYLINLIDENNSNVQRFVKE